MSDLKFNTVKLVDCSDLDDFIFEATGREWNTLEAAARDYLSGNGVISTVDATYEPGNWGVVSPEDKYYSDSIWGQLEAVEKWVNSGGEAPDYLRTESIMIWLASEGKLEPGRYVIHLWW